MTPVSPLPWQDANIRAMAYALQQNNVVLDTSDGGAGKTWMTAFVAKRLGYRLTVICPKLVIATWKDVCQRVGVPLDLAINPEKLIGTTWKPTDSDNEKAPLPIGYWSRKKVNWHWFLRKRSILVFDEVHRQSGYKSISGKLVVASKRQNLPTIMLSATVADSPIKLRAIGFRLGICPFLWDEWVAWLQTQGVEFSDYGAMIWPPQKSLAPLHKRMIRKGVLTGVNTSEIPGYPKNRLHCEIIASSPSVDRAYEAALEELRENAETEGVEALRARQLAELHKVAWCVEEAQKVQEEGHSIFIATVFQKTAEILAKELGVIPITGNQDLSNEEVGAMIADFQTNRTHVFVGTQASIAEGISLHDLNGKPRQSILFPNFHSLKFIQASKRIHRTGGLSPCLQRIPFLDNWVETRMRERIDAKLTNLSEITDNDFSISGTFP